MSNTLIDYDSSMLVDASVQRGRKTRLWARDLVTDWRARQATKAAGQGLKPESGCMGLESGTTLSQNDYQDGDKGGYVALTDAIDLATTPPTPITRVLPPRSVPPDSAVNGRLTTNAKMMRVMSSAEERERAEAQVRELGEVKR